MRRGPSSLIIKPLQCLATRTTQVTADPSGEEHFFGNGTRNARTDFNDSSAPAKIRQAIDYYLDTVVPGRRPGWSPHTGDNCWYAHEKER